MSGTDLERDLRAMRGGGAFEEDPEVYDTRTRLESHYDSLGPHARRLMLELLGSYFAGCAAGVIVLAAAVLDVALREPSGVHSGADGPTLSAARDSKDAYWLRERRNGIVHYEGGKDGLMGDAGWELPEDADRALSVLADALETLAKR